MPKLILLVGNIGCGKSTMASKLVQNGAVVANMDSIFFAIEGGDYNRYVSKHKAIYQVVESAIINSALLQGIDVVVDRTSMDVKTRKKYIDIGKSFGAKIVVYDWGSGARRDLERRLTDNRGTSEETWRQVFDERRDAYEKPTIEEGIDEIIEVY